MYKETLKDIQTGDYVIVSSNSGLHLLKVTKRVTTQIHVNDKKYRLDGSAISSENWYITRIYAPLSKAYSSEETWLDIYNKQQQKIKDEKEELINKIKATDLSKISISKLKIVLKELS